MREGRKLQNEELNILFCSPNIVRVIKSRGTCGRCMQHVWGRLVVYRGFWWGNLGERDHLEDPGLDGRILRYIFRKRVVRAWTVST